MLVSDDDFITCEIDSFKPTIMKQTMPDLVLLPHHNRSFLPQNILDIFCKYISSKIIHTSSEIFPSMRNLFAHLAASIVPLLTSCSNDKDGNKEILK